MAAWRRRRNDKSARILQEKDAKGKNRRVRTCEGFEFQTKVEMRREVSGWGTDKLHLYKTFKKR
jgi:hypothetical protein